MKKNLFSVMMLAVAAFTVACDGGEENGVKISLDPPSISGINFEGDTKTVNVDSPIAWEIEIAEADKEWLSVKPESGEAGKTPVTFTIEKNMDAERTANVVIKGSGASVTIKVAQNGYEGNAPKIAVTDAEALPLELYIDNPDDESLFYWWYKDGEKWEVTDGFKPSARAEMTDEENTKSFVNVYVKGVYTVKAVYAGTGAEEYDFSDESKAYDASDLNDFYVTSEVEDNIATITFDQAAAATDEEKQYFAVLESDLEAYDPENDDLMEILIEGNGESITVEAAEAGKFVYVAVEVDENGESDESELVLTGRRSNSVEITFTLPEAE